MNAPTCRSAIAPLLAAMSLPVAAQSNVDAAPCYEGYQLGSWARGNSETRGVNDAGVVVGLVVTARSKKLAPSGVSTR